MRIYGWRPDKPDVRDVPHSLRLRAKLAHVVTPPSFDMRPRMPPVFDQESLGSCTGNAISGAIQYIRLREQQPQFVPSRLFIYYNERAMEGTINSDAGAEIRDGIKVVVEHGVCPEEHWPYDISQFDVRPSADCYTESMQDLVKSYARVDQSLDSMRACLALDFPIVAGFSVYEAFESPSVASTGVVPMPIRGERALGGHAVLIVGYDDASDVFIVRNSWGVGWGMDGYFTIPYNYLTDSDLASDFWQIDATT